MRTRGPRRRQRSEDRGGRAGGLPAIRSGDNPERRPAGAIPVDPSDEVALAGAAVIAGTSDHVAEELARLADTGIDRVVVPFLGDGDGQLELIGKRVLPRLSWSLPGDQLPGRTPSSRAKRRSWSSAPTRSSSLVSALRPSDRGRSAPTGRIRAIRPGRGLITTIRSASNVAS